MRLHFRLSPGTQPVPFDYQHFLTGAFHKWLGENELHDGISLYSLSWLSGGKREGNGLSFSSGTTWFISAHDEKLLHTIADRASICPVIVEGPPEATQFAWNVGIGHLTGSGFGSLM